MGCNGKCDSITLPTNLQQGDPGTSINWLGVLNDFPAAPSTLDAFRHDVNGIVYIYNSTQWEVMVEDGKNLSPIHPYKLLISDYAVIEDTIQTGSTEYRSNSFTAQDFTNGSIIEIRSVVSSSGNNDTNPEYHIDQLIGNSSNPVSTSNLLNYRIQTKQELTVELYSRLIIKDVETAVNNVQMFARVEVYDPPGFSVYKNNLTKNISLDVSNGTDVHIFTKKDAISVTDPITVEDIHTVVERKLFEE